MSLEYKVDSASVCLPRLLTLSSLTISGTNRPILIKFYQKHHLGGEKAALGIGPDRIRTLVSMATDNSHMVITGERVLPLFLGKFSSDLFYTCWSRARGHT